MTTSIAWTDESWNPIVGCSKISAGCANCYAASAAKSARLQQFPQYQKVEKWDGTIEFVESQLLKPLSWRSPKKIFTCSMSDVFHENALDEWRDRAFAIMALCPQHTFQILTKRPDIMLKYISGLTTNRLKRALPSNIEYSRLDSVKLPLQNVWLGVSVENQVVADERIPLLLETPAEIRFLSCEPLLEEVHLEEWLWQTVTICWGNGDDEWGYDGEPTDRLHWVICGGESGSKARQCNVDWIRSLVRQCQDAEIPVFVKQLGANVIGSSPYIADVADTHHQIKFRDRKASDISEWPEDLRIQQFPN
ncbi:phage Gp37/Gp68 family protein [Aerosakkonema sp. BLCC-F183]|uniref:phage Gp37/Gp68 family protein n=1 Tax=Aerosakkonema sp. BLCC-F183 TaxID=3342834 RepID=UPI0035B7584E